jgi:hypothetical protein
MPLGVALFFVKRAPTVQGGDAGVPKTTQNGAGFAPNSPGPAPKGRILAAGRRRQERF